MVVDAERKGGAITAAGDPRITRVGQWMRRLKLDELPQLINVLIGDMSFVGPRPEVPRYVALYNDKQRLVLDMRPGITDPASIRYRNESELLATVENPDRCYVEKIMPDKLRLNLEYAARATPWSDFVVILKTLLSLQDKAAEGVPRICMLSAEHSPLDKRVFQKEAISLARAGFSVVHLCPAASDQDKIVEDVRLVTFRRRDGRLARLLALPRLFLKARHIDADVYHCNEPDSWLVGVLLRFLRARKVVFDCHEHFPGQVTRGLSWPLSPLAAWATKYYLQLLGLLTHRIILAKYSVADDFTWSRGRLVTVLNTTPLKALEGPAITTPVNDRERPVPFTFVHIGVIRRERGSAQLLQAMRLLDQRGVKHVQVRIVGEFKDGSEAEFFAQADDFGIRDRFEFYRWMPFDEAFSLVRQSHAGIILFQKTLENNVRGMPHKMFDYMLAGLPVIAPDFAPDIVGVLEPAGAGLLVDTSSPEAVARAMQSLIENRSLARQLGDRGRQAVFEKYHWERDAETLIATYHELLGTTFEQSSWSSIKPAA
jgi:glycosyltransferase involved in cell wall biosynthesis